jgi:hypothetical protein
MTSSICNEYFLDDEMADEEMGGICRMRWEIQVYTENMSENTKKRNHLAQLDVD